MLNKNGKPQTGGVPFLLMYASYALSLSGERSLQTWQYEEIVKGIDVFAHREVPQEYTLLMHYVNQAVACVKIAACHYKLGRLKESDDALDKAYNFLKNGYSEEMWNNKNDFCMKFYREPYHEFGLDEYKPCI